MKTLKKTEVFLLGRRRSNILSQYRGQRGRPSLVFEKRQFEVTDPWQPASHKICIQFLVLQLTPSSVIRFTCSIEKVCRLHLSICNI